MSDERTIDPRDLATIEGLRAEVARLKAAATLGDIPPVGEPAAPMDRDKAREALAREYARQGVDALRTALKEALEREERLQAALSVFASVKNWRYGEGMPGPRWTQWVGQPEQKPWLFAQEAFLPPKAPHETSRSAAAAVKTEARK